MSASAASGRLPRAGLGAAGGGASGATTGGGGAAAVCARAPSRFAMRSGSLAAGSGPADLVALQAVAVFGQALPGLDPELAVGRGGGDLPHLIGQLHHPVVPPLLQQEGNQLGLGSEVARAELQRLTQPLLGLLLQPVLGEDLGLGNQVLFLAHDEGLHLRGGALQEVRIDA